MFRLITLFNVFLKKRNLCHAEWKLLFWLCVANFANYRQFIERFREIVLTNFVAHIYKKIETISFNTKSVNSIINSKFTARQFSVCIGGKLVDPKPMPCFEFLWSPPLCFFAFSPLISRSNWRLILTLLRNRWSCIHHSLQATGKRAEKCSLYMHAVNAITILEKAQLPQSPLLLVVLLPCLLLRPRGTLTRYLSPLLDVRRVGRAAALSVLPSLSWKEFLVRGI